MPWIYVCGAEIALFYSHGGDLVIEILTGRAKSKAGSKKD
jgi:hypothetical protein